MFWLVHEALSAQLLWEKLEYDADVEHRNSRERGRERGPKVYCQILGGYVSNIRCLLMHRNPIADLV